MKKTSAYLVSFEEHPTTNIKIKIPHEFDITSATGLRNSDFIENGKFSMAFYCDALLIKIQTLQMREIKPFLQHQLRQLRVPVNWLEDLEMFLIKNAEKFNTIELTQKLDKTKIILQLLLRDLEVEGQSHERHFDFQEIKRQLRTISSLEEKLTLLLEQKADYLQHKPKKIDPLLIPFDEQVDIEIKSLWEISNSIEELRKQKKLQPQLAKPFMEHDKFLDTFGISKGTAQTWRDERIIGFIQIGSKIYYYLSDIDKMIEAHYVKSCRNL